MSLVWERTASRRKWWKLVLLAIAGCVCLLVAGGFHSARQRRMAEQNEDSSVGWDSVSLWHQTSWSGLLSGRRKQTSYRSMGIAAQDAQEAGGAEDASRKMVRTAALEIEVKDPAAVMEQIRALAGRMDGYLVNSQIIGGPDVPAGRITIRVPTLRMEEAIGEIRKLADRIQSEKVEAEDVTQNYVDREATLRNLRAQESQYLLIMRRATTVSDTLEVSSKLGQVRGDIEQQQAEFLALVKQVETVAISVALVPTAETQVLGIHWRPWYAIKQSARDGMEGLASFAVTFTAIIFLLPTIALWVVTLILGAAILVRMLHWVWRKLFTFSRPKPAEGQPVPAA